MAQKHTCVGDFFLSVVLSSQSPTSVPEITCLQIGPAVSMGCQHGLPGTTADLDTTTAASQLTPASDMAPCLKGQPLGGQWCTALCPGGVNHVFLLCQDTGWGYGKGTAQI